MWNGMELLLGLRVKSRRCPVIASLLLAAPIEVASAVHVHCACKEETN